MTRILRKHWFSYLVLLGLVIVAAIFLLNSGQGRTIVLVIIDTCRKDTLGCYGSSSEITPNIDEWASEAVRFDAAIATSSWTLPSITSMLASAHPTLHGGLGKGLDLRRIRSEISYGPELLRDSGFSTHAIMNCAFLGPTLGVQRGFDSYDYDGAYIRHIRRADKTVDAALEVLRDNQGKDVFLVVHFFDPHMDFEPLPPYDEMFTAGYPRAFWNNLDEKQVLAMTEGRLVPEEQDQKYIRGLHEGEVAFVDEHFGRLVEGIRALGSYRSATIVLTSDHGEEFWDHGGFEHGHTLYDELINVPLVIKPPENIIPAREVVTSQVSLIDIMPTILEIAGVPPPDSFEGHSLIPLIAGGDEPQDRPAFSEGTLYGSNKLSLRLAGYKYIYDTATEDGRLFSCREDPDESVNLVDTLPQKAEDMEEELLRIHQSLLDRASELDSPEKIDMTDDMMDRLKSLGYIR